MKHSGTSIVFWKQGLDGVLLSRQSICALNLLPASWHSVFVRSAECSYWTQHCSAAPTPASGRVCRRFPQVTASTYGQSANGHPVGTRCRTQLGPHCPHHTVCLLGPHKRSLDSLIDDRIIEPVTEPSAWCHPIVHVRKKGITEMRLTADLRKLNDQVRRPTHPARTPHDAVAAIVKVRYFTKLDARHGYWQVPLSDDAKPLTTLLHRGGGTSSFATRRALYLLGMCFTLAQMRRLIVSPTLLKRMTMVLCTIPNWRLISPKLVTLCSAPVSTALPWTPKSSSSASQKSTTVATISTLMVTPSTVTRRQPSLISQYPLIALTSAHSSG